MTFLHKVLITGYTLKWFVVETPASDLKKSCKTLINFEYSKIYAFTPFSCIKKSSPRETRGFSFAGIALIPRGTRATRNAV